MNEARLPAYTTLEYMGVESQWIWLVHRCIELSDGRTDGWCDVRCLAVGRPVR